MKTKLFFWSLFLFFLSKISFAQQLVINEVSQGPSGAKEYVELLVVGSPTCNSIPCMDLRNYIIDDNNGNHATGAGVGIAAGCVRLKNIAFWQCIPYGTIILIYNDADQNASVPPQDLSMLDGNCRLVIPISDCTLLERHTSQPSTGSSTYPTTGFTNCGNWTPISMANSDDSFQTIDPTGSFLHSVSWGNNTLATIIYFAAGAGGNVAIMTNAVNNNPANQLNWVMSPVIGNETPGNPNNAANSAWISSMNNGCLPLLPFTASVSSTNAGCTCNGSATVTAAGAIAPYTYTWFPSGGNLNTASGLCSGSYTVSSTSSNGCNQTLTVNIASASSLSATIVNQSVTCFGLSNGSATVTPSGGNGPYSYTWSPSGGNASTSNGLVSGTYTVLVKDANNCTVTAVTSIVQPASAVSAITSVTNVLCFGSATGIASVSASGGTPGYTYTWSPSGGNAAQASLLAAGNYTVLIKDINNCTLTANVIVNQPAALSAIIVFTNATCGMSNGSASATTSGGTPGYTYTWIPSGGNLPLASNLSQGNYSIVITDANNCQLTKTVTILQPTSMVFTVSTTSVTCNGGSTGSSSINVSGGNIPYSYTWSPAPGSGQGSSVASGLSAQIYTITVKDNLGCTTFTTATITQPATALSAIISTTNVLCFGAATGIASVTASGGTGGYTYTWNPSGGNTAIASSLSAGGYSVIVKDANNCLYTANTIVTQPIAALTSAISATNILCFGANNGIASVTANGGTAGYTYNWSPSGGNSNTATNLAPGNYTVTVKDVNNCTVTSFTSISQPTAALNAIIANNSVNCNGGTTGSATVTVNGGTTGYNYTWIPSLTSSSVNTGLVAGTYTAFILDANNCSFSITTTITQPLPISLNVNAIKLCNGQPGVLSANVNGGVGPYSYFWNGTPGASTIAISTTASAVYTISVTDASGCNSPIDTAQVSITSPLALSISATRTICQGSATSLSVGAIGGSGIYQYAWLPGNMSGQIISVNLNNTTVYTVNVTDGCSQPASITTTVYVETIGTATLTVNKHKGCTPVCISFTNPIFSSSITVQSSLWTFGDGSASNVLQPEYCYNKEGTYTAYNSFTTASGCTMTLVLEPKINVFQTPEAEFSADKYSFDYNNALVNFYNQSTNGVNYFWDFAGLSNSILENPAYNFNEPGKYLVALVASNGACSDTVYHTIECLPAFTFYAPNTFTPNDDNLNNIFLALGEGWDINTYSMMIFDRWGERIYSTNQFNAGWDGKLKGQEVKEDTYTWKISLKDIFGKQHQYIGHVSVIR
ncbi:MAG: gliding motility-associated C-terminal domain-containing protein [Bacteroidetes bacterium]|nr:gliding motility-associated C-terminal domain-containing protein [Bacteroidota bacterium]